MVGERPQSEWVQRGRMCVLLHCEMGGVVVQWQQAFHVIGCRDRRSCKIQALCRA